LIKIKGLKTEQIIGALGQRPHDEVIHRDNMAVTTAKAEGGKRKAEE
jgi:glutamate 5-kinase